jgi:hypothetical protein
MNINNINNLGFIFTSSKIIIKDDDVTDYFNGNPKAFGLEYCNYNDKNKVSVFKLNKKNFVASSLSVATSKEEFWNLLKINIYDYINKPFIISLSKNGIHNSFYSKLINAKVCNCEEQDLFLYFKFNFIANLFNPIFNKDTNTINYQNMTVPVTSIANLTFNLKEGVYENVKFYCDENEYNN